MPTRITSNAESFYAVVVKRFPIENLRKEATGIIWAGILSQNVCVSFTFLCFFLSFWFFFGSFVVSYINNIILITIFIEWYKGFGKYNSFKLLKFSTIQNNLAISQFVRFFKDFSQFCLKTLVYQNMHKVIPGSFVT